MATCSSACGRGEPALERAAELYDMAFAAANIASSCKDQLQVLCGRLKHYAFHGPRDRHVHATGQLELLMQRYCEGSDDPWMVGFSAHVASELVPLARTVERGVPKVVRLGDRSAVAGKPLHHLEIAFLRRD